MKKLAFLTPVDAEYGFQLAGFSQYITDKNEAANLLDEIVQDAEYGLAVVDERLLDEGLEEKIKILQTLWDGIIVMLPPPAFVSTGEEDFAARLLRRAIGYHVRLD